MKTKNMQDFKLEYTEPDKVYETVDTKPKEPQYRYYEIEVSRKQIAWVNVRVPYNQKLDFRNSHEIAERATEQIVQNYEWEEDYPPEIEVESIKEITEEEANEYHVYESN